MASTQAKATVKTYVYVWLLNHTASHTIAIIGYKASEMILRIHSDASHLSVSHACIRDGGHHYLSENSDYPSNNEVINNI